MPDDRQFAFALNQADTGTSIIEVTSIMGISDVIFYNWKRKFGYVGINEILRLRQLEDDNSPLKQIVADLTLDKQVLQDVLKKCLKICQLKILLQILKNQYKVST